MTAPSVEFWGTSGIFRSGWIQRWAVKLVVMYRDGTIQTTPLSGHLTLRAATRASRSGVWTSWWDEHVQGVILTVERA